MTRFLIALALLSTSAFAADTKSSRWSLAEWMEQRDKMRMQDIWLALHSASPYEFFVGGNYQFAARTPGGYDPGWRGEFSAYASIFGLGVEYDSLASYSRFNGQFNFRFFGPRAQGTNITAQVGLRNQTESGDTFRNLYLGLQFTMYMTKFFGIEGAYRYHFDSTTSTLGVINGNALWATAFVEFNFFRVYFSYVSEQESKTLAGSTSPRGRVGPLVGGRFYF